MNCLERLYKKLKDFSPEEDIIITNFVSRDKICHWKCNICGEEFDAIPNTVLSRHQHHICKNCYPPLNQRDKEKKEYAAIQRELEKNKSVRLIDIYTDRHLKVKFQCLDCGQINDFYWKDRRNLDCNCCKGTRKNINAESFNIYLIKNMIISLRYWNIQVKVKE